MLLHGFPNNSHIHDDLIPHLVAAARRTIAFDFLGFGGSDKPEGAVYTFERQLGDLTPQGRLPTHEELARFGS